MCLNALNPLCLSPLVMWCTSTEIRIKASLSLAATKQPETVSSDSVQLFIQTTEKS